MSRKLSHNFRFGYLSCQIPSNFMYDLIISNLVSLSYEALRNVFKGASEKLNYNKITSSALGQSLAKSGLEFIIAFGFSFLDSLKKNPNSLENIERNLNKLIKQPLRTAIDQMNSAGKIIPKDDQELLYRDSRYREALSNLDKAYSLANEVEKPIINLLKAFACSNIRGAEQEARVHLISFQQSVKQNIARIELQLHENTVEVEKLENELKLDPNLKYKPGLGGGLLASEISKDLIIRKAKETLVKRLMADRVSLSQELAESQETVRAIYDQIT